MRLSRALGRPLGLVSVESDDGLAPHLRSAAPSSPSPSSSSARPPSTTALLLVQRELKQRVASIVFAIVDVPRTMREDLEDQVDWEQESVAAMREWVRPWFVWEIAIETLWWCAWFAVAACLILALLTRQASWWAAAQVTVLASGIPALSHVAVVAAASYASARGWRHWGGIWAVSRIFAHRWWLSETGWLIGRALAPHPTTASILPVPHVAQWRRFATFRTHPRDAAVPKDLVEPTRETAPATTAAAPLAHTAAEPAEEPAEGGRSTGAAAEEPARRASESAHRDPPTPEQRSGTGSDGATRERIPGAAAASSTAAAAATTVAATAAAAAASAVVARVVGLRGNVAVQSSVGARASLLSSSSVVRRPSRVHADAEPMGHRIKAYAHRERGSDRLRGGLEEVETNPLDERRRSEPRTGRAEPLELDDTEPVLDASTPPASFFASTSSTSSAFSTSSQDSSYENTLVTQDSMFSAILRDSPSTQAVRGEDGHLDLDLGSSAPEKGCRTIADVKGSDDINDEGAEGAEDAEAEGTKDAHSLVSHSVLLTARRTFQKHLAPSMTSLSDWMRPRRILHSEPLQLLPPRIVSGAAAHTRVPTRASVNPLKTSLQHRLPTEWRDPAWWGLRPRPAEAGFAVSSLRARLQVHAKRVPCLVKLGILIFIPLYALPLVGTTMAVPATRVWLQHAVLDNLGLTEDVITGPLALPRISGFPLIDFLLLSLLSPLAFALLWLLGMTLVCEYRRGACFEGRCPACAKPLHGPSRPGLRSSRGGLCYGGRGRFPRFFGSEPMPRGANEEPEGPTGHPRRTSADEVPAAIPLEASAPSRASAPSSSRTPSECRTVIAGWAMLALLTAAATTVQVIMGLIWAATPPQARETDESHTAAAMQSTTLRRVIALLTQRPTPLNVSGEHPPIEVWDSLDLLEVPAAVPNSTVFDRFAALDNSDTSSLVSFTTLVIAVHAMLGLRWFHAIRRVLWTFPSDSLQTRDFPATHIRVRVSTRELLETILYLLPQVTVVFAIASIHLVAPFQKGSFILDVFHIGTLALAHLAAYVINRHHQSPIFLPRSSLVRPDPNPLGYGVLFTAPPLSSIGRQLQRGCRTPVPRARPARHVDAYVPEDDLLDAIENDATRQWTSVGKVIAHFRALGQRATNGNLQGVLRLVSDKAPRAVDAIGAIALHGCAQAEGENSIPPNHVGGGR